MKVPIAMAHSPSMSGREDTVSSHLEDVAETAAYFAEAFGASEEARAAGLLHDLGKYGGLFQKRLNGEVRGVDHWSVGAWAAVRYFLTSSGIATALAIQGHHIGLQQASKDALRELDPLKLQQYHPLGLRLSDTNIQALIDQLHTDNLSIPSVKESIYQWPRSRNVGDMLDVRMLYSALVDADFLETEAHFKAQTSLLKNRRPSGPSLQAETSLAVLSRHLDCLARKTNSSDNVTKLRSKLLTACLQAADRDVGLFTLTAPTGSGKTLSMLAFALKHALKHNLRRVVVVIPYLTIIEQTVNVYRKALRDMQQDDWLRRYVLENHSLAGTKGNSVACDSDDNADSQERLLAENWDAPIVVTTSVQFFESLFANRPGACRKLHRLAQSVVLLDEVQTMPVRLAVPTLGALAKLSSRYRTSIVFATATQPAFDHLDPVVTELCGQRWQPIEIVPRDARLFQLAKRTRVEWPELGVRLPWEDVASTIKTTDQVLCIVNLKRHALEILELLKEVEGVFHLSTSMCPAHRDQVLAEVRDRLENGMTCRLVSTQCVEAGVDIDFPTVMRAWGPLDAIAQASGRCNRNGHQEIGVVKVFFPVDKDSLYPDGAYQQAAQVAEGILRERGAGNMDINDETLFNCYYKRLYNVAAPETQCQELLDAVARQHFPDVSRFYRVIDTDAINVLVPYDLEAYRLLADEVLKNGLTADWVRRARRYSIGLFRPRRDDVVWQWLERVPVGMKEKESDTWFLYLNETHYHPMIGLHPPLSMGCIIA